MTHRRPTPRTIPSLVRHPWRATVRTTLLTAIAILPLLPDIARAADIDTLPAVISVLAVAAALQRVIAIPEIDRWLTTLKISAHPPEQYPDKDERT